MRVHARVVARLSFRSSVEVSGDDDDDEDGPDFAAGRTLVVLWIR